MNILPIVLASLLASSPTPPPLPLSHPDAYRQYLAELEGARHDGLWTDIRQVQQPLPPVHQNAAIEYTEYAALRKSNAVKADEDLIKEFLSTKPHANAEIANIRAVLKREHALLLLAHAAAMKPSCVFQRKWTQGDPTSVLFPELISIRAVARLITAESILMAHDGKLQQAVTNQRLCFRLAKHASSEPILISYLVAVASQAIALHGMDRILALSTQHPQIAASIKIAIHSDYQTISPSYALQGETAIFARLMEYTQHMGPVAFANTGRKSGEALRTPKPKALFDEWLDVNGRSTIHQLRELSSNAKLPGKSIYEAIDNQLARLKAYPADDYTLARALSPEFTTSIQHRYLMTATAQSTVIAADVLIWSAQHHRFPSTLAQTTDRVPIDPYSGKPFQYASSSNGFVIWSLGQSGQYNPQQAGLMKDTTAIVFRYP